MTGGLYVVSELVHPETGATVFKRTDAIASPVFAKLMCAHLADRGIPADIVPAVEHYRRLEVVQDWDKYAAEWFRGHVRKRIGTRYAFFHRVMMG